MQNDKLLPCPFCGGEFEEPINTASKQGDIWLWSTECMECGLFIDDKDKGNLIKRVNTRKPMERIVEQLEERRAVFDCRVCRHFDKGDGSECNEDCTDALIDDLFDIVRKGGVDNAG